MPPQTVMSDEQRADDVESDRERHGQLHPGTENEGGERTDCDPERLELVAAVMDQFADKAPTKAPMISPAGGKNTMPTINPTSEPRAACFEPPNRRASQAGNR